MPDIPVTHYAVLRDGRQWQPVLLTVLELAPDGALQLARVPAPAEEIDIPGPFTVEPSGVAAGNCGDLYIADTANNRVTVVDAVCGERMILPFRGGPGTAPGYFQAPRGLLIGPAGLYVADSGNARVQIFRLPTLETRDEWSGPFQEPTGLARDTAGRIYVLDRGIPGILRFSVWGTPDADYNSAVAGQLAAASPKFLAIDEADTLYITDDAASTILRFDASGNPLADVPGTGATIRPGALAAFGDQLYVADVDSGVLHVFSVRAQVFIGTIPGWRGPAAAIAAGGDGTLFVKSGDDDAVHRLDGNAGCVSAGRLDSGPLDAGELLGWVRVRVSAEQPARTSVKLQFFVADADSPPPSAADWVDSLSLDTLLPRFKLPDFAELQAHRFLWLRVRIESEDGHANPRLLQVQAETPGEDYMDQLPSVYGRKDDGTLRRWLAAFHAELGDLELMLEEMSRRFNAATAPAEDLTWLASWLAFDPPSAIDPDKLRELLSRAIALYRRRGTSVGVREWVELYTGVRPVIVESFRDRRIWQLGHTSLLGFDTALAPARAMVVPDSELPDSDGGIPAQGCGATERLVAGSFIVGESVALAPDEAGEPLFDGTAHHFSVWIPAGGVSETSRRYAVRRTLDAEKPAHTDYDLCVAEPQMRVGLQASVGINAVVAGAPAPMELSGGVLGLNSYLGDSPGEHRGASIGSALVESDTVLE